MVVNRRNDFYTYLYKNCQGFQLFCSVHESNRTVVDRLRIFFHFTKKKSLWIRTNNNNNTKKKEKKKRKNLTRGFKSYNDSE